ncbi:SRE1 [Auxenochlorella protothecoides x Auxenochlorella symbiontica]
MATYYHEARAQARALKDRTTANKARSERRLTDEEAQREDPVHALRLRGHACAVPGNSRTCSAADLAQGLVQLPGGAPGEDVDRFDARMLLDPAELAAAGPAPGGAGRGPADTELEEQLAFESYRDVIRWACQGLAPHEGLAHAAQEDVAIRTAQRRAALGLAAGMRGGGGPAGRDPGYAAGGLGHDAPTDGDRVSASEGSGDEGGGEDPGADVRMDALARAYGVADFSAMLRWAVRREAAAAAAGLSARLAPRGPAGGWAARKRALRLRAPAGQDGCSEGAGTHAGSLDWIPVQQAVEVGLRPCLSGVGLRPGPSLRGQARDRDVGARAGAQGPTALPGSQTAPQAHQQSPGPAPPPARETPKERLQRLMAAQLGKKIHQDAAAQALRRSQEVREAAALSAAHASQAPRRAGAGGNADPSGHRKRRGGSRSRSRDPPRRCGERNRRSPPHGSEDERRCR